MRNHFSLEEKGFRTSKKNLFCAYPGVSLCRAAIWGIRIALSPPAAPPRFAPALIFPELRIKAPRKDASTCIQAANACVYRRERTVDNSVAGEAPKSRCRNLSNSSHSERLVARSGVERSSMWMAPCRRRLRRRCAKKIFFWEARNPFSSKKKMGFEKIL